MRILGSIVEPMTGLLAIGVADLFRRGAPPFRCRQGRALARRRHQKDDRPHSGRQPVHSFQTLIADLATLTKNVADRSRSGLIIPEAPTLRPRGMAM